jgi:opacity protein-like surface antigen
MRRSEARSATRGPRTVIALTATLLLSPGLARAEASGLPPEVGYNYGDIETPRAAAMNGAVRASGAALEALFFNPAGMPTTRVYHIGAIAQVWPEASRQSYGGGAIDSIVSSARLAGGLGGTWNLQDPDGLDRRSTDIRFALAYPFSEHFFVGAGMRYLWLEQNGQGPLGASLASGGLEDDDIVRTITFDAGVTVRPADFLSFALVGANLSHPGHGFLPTTLGGGVSVGSRMFTLEADALADFTTWGRTTTRAMGGAEVLASDNFPLRLGYRYDEGAGSHSVSGGLGYVERMFAVELAVRRVVSGDVATAIVLGFTYHLESTELTPTPTDTF